MDHQDNLSSSHVGIQQQIQTEIARTYLNSLHHVQKLEQSIYERKHFAQHHHSWDCSLLVCA